MTPDRVPYPLLKSITDKALSALMLVLVSPVALGALAAIAVDMLIKPRDRGPVLIANAASRAAASSTCSSSGRFARRSWQDSATAMPGRSRPMRRT